MSKLESCNLLTDDEKQLAADLVEARRRSRALETYPGAMPSDSVCAYRIQDEAIRLWPDEIGGWKTTMVIPAEYGSDFIGRRLMGPAFRSALFRAELGGAVDVPLIEGGFSGLEPEMIVCVGRDAPSDKFEWTSEEAIDIVGSLHIGAEVVSSPVPNLGMISLPVMASDFGANGGVVIGPHVQNWQSVPTFSVDVHIDGRFVAAGEMAMLDGVLDAFAFALGECARRGYPLRQGNVITTGTLTGFHPMVPAQSVRFNYHGQGVLDLRVIDAGASVRL